MATITEAKAPLNTTLSASSTSTSPGIHRAISRNGHAYETNSSVIDPYAPNANILPSRPTCPKAHVLWRPSRVWQNTSDEVRNSTGIQRWIIEVGGLIFKYRLRVESNRSGTFRFWDSDRPVPDHYDLTINIVDRIHYVDYNSESPAISAVQIR